MSAMVRNRTCGRSADVVERFIEYEKSRRASCDRHGAPGAGGVETTRIQAICCIGTPWPT